MQRSDEGSGPQGGELKKCHAPSPKKTFNPIFSKKMFTIFLWHLTFDDTSGNLYFDFWVLSPLDLSLSAYINNNNNAEVVYYTTLTEFFALTLKLWNLQKIGIN